MKMSFSYLFLNINAMHNFMHSSSHSIIRSSFSFNLWFLVPSRPFAHSHTCLLFCCPFLSFCPSLTPLSDYFSCDIYLVTVYVVGAAGCVGRLWWCDVCTRVYELDSPRSQHMSPLWVCLPSTSLCPALWCHAVALGWMRGLWQSPGQKEPRLTTSFTRGNKNTKAIEPVTGNGSVGN